uniref:Uncharacterized protein n=1 Tax=Knipowitschia caucasica TaxID=637954 RepID=A0AAV2LR26_KNICA
MPCSSPGGHRATWPPSRSAGQRRGSDWGGLVDGLEQRDRDPNKTREQSQSQRRSAVLADRCSPDPLSSSETPRSEVDLRRLCNAPSTFQRLMELICEEGEEGEEGEPSLCRSALSTAGRPGGLHKRSSSYLPLFALTALQLAVCLCSAHPVTTAYKPRSFPSSSVSALSCSRLCSYSMPSTAAIAKELHNPMRCGVYLQR